MKKLIKVCLAIQILGFCVGFYYLQEGFVGTGVWNMTLNFVFFWINIKNHKDIQKHEQ